MSQYEIISLYNLGESPYSIAREKNVSAKTIYNILHNNNVQVKKGLDVNLYKDDLIKLYNQNLSSNKISKELGISRSTVINLCRQLNLDTSRFKGLNLETNKDNIIKDYQNGLGITKLSKKYNCSESGIRNLFKRCNIKSGIHQKKYHIPSDFFDKIDTQEKAYILGFFVGDGCQSNNSFQIVSADLEIVEKIRDIMGDRPIHKYIDKRNEHWQPIYHYAFKSKHLCNRLTQLGCPPNKTFLTFIPGEAELPNSLFRHWLRGLLDSDGSLYIDNKGHWTLFFCTSKTLSNSVQSKIKELYNLDFNINKHDNIERVISSDKNMIKSLLDILYKDSIIHLNRKFDKYKELTFSFPENINRTS